MRKKYIILAVSLALIFSIFYYKNSKLGNTIINLSEEKNIENILNNELKYNAKLKVKVYSNKNENEYDLKVKENKDYSLIEVIGDKNISGLEIEKKNGDLFIRNNNLKLEKIYENYKEFTDNSLLLSSFVKEYQESEEKEKTEKDGEIIIEYKLKNYSKYIKYKQLYFNKKTGKPIKMIIKDSSKQVKISIRYTSIEIL